MLVDQRLCNTLLQVHSPEYRSVVLFVNISNCVKKYLLHQ